jgi:hypothetical protein
MKPERDCAIEEMLSAGYATVRASQAGHAKQLSQGNPMTAVEQLKARFPYMF